MREKFCNESYMSTQESIDIWIRSYIEISNKRYKVQNYWTTLHTQALTCIILSSKLLLSTLNVSFQNRMGEKLFWTNMENYMNYKRILHYNTFQ